VFPVRYGLNSYMLFRRNQIFQVLRNKGNCRGSFRKISFSFKLLAIYNLLRMRLSSASYLVTHKYITKAVLEARLEHMIT
jgi:hypothetical protein